MDSSILVEKDISDGKKILEALDKTKIKPNAAMWYKDPDESDYRLVFASSFVDRNGPRNTYQEIVKAVKTIPIDERVPLEKITVVKHADPLIKNLKAFADTKPDTIGSIRIRNSVVNGVLIEDAFVYRNG